MTVVTTIAQFFQTLATTAPSPIPSGSTTVVHVTEIDKVPLLISTIASDTYVAQSAGQTSVFGSMAFSFPPKGAAQTYTTTAYASPQLVNVGPAASPAAWTNSPAATIVQSFTGGPSYQRVIAANGTYQEAGYIPSPGGTAMPIAIVESADGSGSYSGIFRTDQQGIAGDNECSFSFSAPALRGTPPVPKIDVKASKLNPSPSPSASPCASPTSYASVPAWFPSPPPPLGTGSPAPVFYAESDTAAAGVLVPSGCGPATATSATVVTRTIWQLDTIVGFSEYSTVATYESPAGAVICMMLSDTLANYYDWTGTRSTGRCLPRAGSPSRR